MFGFILDVAANALGEIIVQRVKPDQKKEIRVFIEFYDSLEKLVENARTIRSDFSRLIEDNDAKAAPKFRNSIRQLPPLTIRFSKNFDKIEKILGIFDEPTQHSLRTIRNSKIEISESLITLAGPTIFIPDVEFSKRSYFIRFLNYRKFKNSHSAILEYWKSVTYRRGRNIRRRVYDSIFSDNPDWMSLVSAIKDGDLRTQVVQDELIKAVKISELEEYGHLTEEINFSISQLEKAQQEFQEFLKSEFKVSDFFR